MLELTCIPYLWRRAVIDNMFLKLRPEHEGGTAAITDVFIWFVRMFSRHVST